MRQWLTSFVAAACLMGASSHAFAAWPNDRPITLVVNNPAGSGVDLVARVIADALSKKWGANVIVEDKPGACGTIAQAFVAKAPPDGYTFIEETPCSGANAVLMYKNLPYDPVKDFSFIARTNSDAMVLFVGPNLPQVHNLKDFIAYAKANPGKLQFGNPGLGTYGQMTELEMQDFFGVTFNPVAYRGTPEMITDMLGKQIDADIDLSGGYLPQVQAGTLRAIAVFGSQRDPRLPDAQTTVEQGSNLTVEAWSGIEGPKGIPTDIINKMNAAVADILLHDDAARTKLMSIGVTPDPSTPDEFATIIKNEIEKWRPVVTKYNIHAD